MYAYKGKHIRSSAASHYFRSVHISKGTCRTALEMNWPLMQLGGFNLRSNCHLQSRWGEIKLRSIKKNHSPSLHLAEVEGNSPVRQRLLVQVFGITPDERRHVITYNYEHNLFQKSNNIQSVPTSFRNKFKKKCI